MLEPPRAPRRPHEITRHGRTRIDPWYWLMDRERTDAEVLELLRAENDYADAALAASAPTAERIYDRIRSRIIETDTSVPVRRGRWWHFTRTREGASYAIVCRAPARPDESPPSIDPESPVRGEEVVLDENVEAEGHEYFSAGVLAISPDDRWVAVGVDLEGDELHRVTFRPLDAQAGSGEVIDGVHYGFCWANDSRHCFYTTVDDAMRPHRLWRHELGTPPDQDVLIMEEPDPRFAVGVGRSRDRRAIIVMVSSAMTTETHWIDADDPTGDMATLDPRREGIEYSVEHVTTRSGERLWLKATNEGATDFRLLARGEDEVEWREVIAHRPGTRLDGVDAFADFLALSERLDGCAAVRIVPLGPGGLPPDPLAESWMIEGPASPATVALSSNPEYSSGQLRVVLTSMITPTTVADVDIASREVIVRKQQRVKGGYRAEDYVSARLWAAASDGYRIPVTVIARRGDLDADDGALVAPTPRPTLLYGYGAYEISMDPFFSTAVLSLLDEGVVFAIAHVRGGGEMGRAWYEMGRLAQKPTSFSDFVTVARDLIARKITSPDRLAARGGSAGGLLVAAAMNLDPSLFRCVVAEVPFVDCLTTMLDDTLPLTAGEWEEWGNPHASPTAYRTIACYSPYDNVTAGDADDPPRRYPDVYATAGLNDPLVGYWEPAKWVQRLREASPGSLVTLTTELGMGHQGPSGRYDAWRDEARTLAFVVDRVVPSP